MACFTTSSYYITGCTDANLYTKTATSVDFQMKGASTGGVELDYKVCLQKYDSHEGWINWECKYGSFLHQTGIISFSLTNRRPPQGSYRIRVDFNEGAPAGSAIGHFYLVTTSFTIQ